MQLDHARLTPQASDWLQHVRTQGQVSNGGHSTTVISKHQVSGIHTGTHTLLKKTYTVIQTDIVSDHTHTVTTGFGRDATHLCGY